MLRYEASILHADIECGRFFTIIQNDKGDLGVACGPGCSGLRFAPALLRWAKPLPSLTRNFAALRLTHPDYASLVDPLCGEPQRGAPTLL